MGVVAPNIPNLVTFTVFGPEGRHGVVIEMKFRREEQTISAVLRAKSLRAE